MYFLTFINITITTIHDHKCNIETDLFIIIKHNIHDYYTNYEKKCIQLL